MGYAHIGVIRALRDADIRIDMVNGSSMGAVMAGAYALHADIDYISSIVHEMAQCVGVKLFNIFRSGKDARPFVRGWMANAICDISLLRKSILPHSDVVRTLEMIFGENRYSDTRIPFSSVAVDLISGKIVHINEGKLVDGILPSVSIPGVFPPVERGRQLLSDGSILSDVPIRELKEQGAEFVIGVKLGPKAGLRYETGFDILNIIETMKEDTIVEWELKQADFVIDIDIPGMNIFDFETSKVAIEAGYQITSKLIPSIERKLSSHE